MTKKEKVIRHISSIIIMIAASFIVIWLRSGSEAASMLIRFEVSGIVFSTTDYFVILAAGLCGYRYGIFLFISTLIAQAITNGGAVNGLFALMIYLAVAMISGVFAEKRWYGKIWRAALAAFDFSLILGGSWYVMFIQIADSQSFYSNMELWQMFLGAAPESFGAVLTLFLFFRLTPDRIKKVIGIGYIYTAEYEQSPEYLESKHSVLKRQVTVMSLCEAVLLSFFAILISNTQINGIIENQRYRLNSQRMIPPSTYQSEETTSADNITVSKNDNTEENEVSGSDSRQEETASGENAGGFVEFTEEQLRRFSENIAVDDRYFFVMNVQLAFLILSVSLPLGMFFNELMLRRVVLPIKNLSSSMNAYFSDNAEEREEIREKLGKVDFRSEYNEIGQLQRSMKRMVDDMEKYIDQVRKERADLEIAEARSEAKSLFLSNMSHEIRTPINAILGMNEMILRESRENNTIAYAENVRTAGNTLLGLVNDILDFSKIEAGKMDIIPVNYDLASVLNDLVTMVQTRADNKGLALIVKVDSEIPDQLRGDEIRIKQIATNILTNAIKYTEKGSVTIEVGYERYEDEPDTIGLRFTVSDTGIGIKEEDMNKLFSAFERIEEERNRTIEGTGLGMNITQRLLAMMDSRLEVSSVYGQGSVFAFTVKQKVIEDVPIGNYEESYRRTLAERRRYREKFTAPDARILVVDDTRMNLTVFRSLLKKTLVQIDTAESGAKCLEMAAKVKYDIIFLDHRMPEKDGIETLSELLSMKDSPNVGTPAICLTANAVSGAKEMYISAGFDDYLTKPIDPDHLESALIKYLPAEKVHIITEEEAAAEEENEVFVSDEPEGIPKWLLSVRTLDAAEGMKHCGDLEIYLETLTVYAESAKAGADEIERFWNERDIENVTVKVHALKSTSRVVGAMRLGDLAEQLEKAGNDGDVKTLEQNMDELLADYRALGEALSPLIQNDSSDDSQLPEIPPDKLEEAYAAIRELAEVFDYDSVLFIMDSLAGQKPPEAERERFERLRTAVAKPDWDMIKDVLK